VLAATFRPQSDGRSIAIYWLLAGDCHGV